MSKEWKASSVEELKAMLEEIRGAMDERAAAITSWVPPEGGWPAVVTLYDEFYLRNDAEVAAEMTRLIRAARRGGGLG